MNRETWIPIAGLVGLFIAGSVMLYATSGPPAPPKEAPSPRPAAGATKAKATVDDAALMVRKEVEDRPAAAEGAKNVVLVVASSWRRDQLTPYGGPADVSPWLDSLAKAGAKFDDAVAAGGWTLPAHVSIATGDYALALGMEEASRKPNAQRLPAQVTTLAERLAGVGYYTMSVNAEPVLGRKAGLMQGFDHYRDAHSDGYEINQKLNAPAAIDIALDLLGGRTEEEAERPFFLQVNLVDPHKPIKVPPEEFKKFEGPDHKIAPYRAVLRRMDDAIRRLDEALAQKGHADDTWFVVVGAHGEGLNMPPAHGKTHGRSVYPSVAMIPWIVRGPGVKPGTAVDALASQVDVMPTILGLLGVPLAEGEKLAGLDLSPLVRGEAGAPAREAAFVDTWYFAANRAAIYTADKGCMLDFGSGELKGEVYADGCFDRKSDLAWERPVEVPGLMDQLRSWRLETAERGKPLLELATPKGGEGGAKGAKVGKKAEQGGEEVEPAGDEAGGDEAGGDEAGGDEAGDDEAEEGAEAAGDEAAEG